MLLCWAWMKWEIENPGKEAKDERELARGGKGKGEVRAGKVGKSDESLMGLGNFEEDVLLSRDADEIWSSISYYVERSG